MADNQDNGSPFVVPKLCIKRVPVQRKQKPAAVESAVDQNASRHRSEQSVSCGSGGLKLVLRVPKDSDPPDSTETVDTSEELADDGKSLAQDSEASRDGVESETVKLSAFRRASAGKSDEPAIESRDPESADDSNALYTADNSAGPKRRRRKKRFRLSTPAQKTKSKLWKADLNEQASSSESPASQRLKRNGQKSKDIKEEDSPAEENTLLSDIAAAACGGVVVEEGPRFPSPSPQTMAGFTPLQLLLDHLLRGFLKKDPDHYFAYPVTEDIAPNYSTIISQPMDFSSIRRKIDANEYKNLRKFKNDIDLISSNAMTYNQKNTIYHLAAKKLQTVTEYMFSKEKMNAARKLIPQLSKLTPEEIRLSPEDVDKVAETKKAKLGHYSCIVDDMSPEEVIEQARSAAAAASKKLKEKHPNIQVTYANDRGPNAKLTTLKSLMPEHLSNIEAKNRPVVLGDLVPKLKEGTPGLPMPDDSKDRVVPVTYLDTGAFSSFVPHYDSTWATLNKDESDLLLAAFGGDEQCVRYVDSIRTFVPDTTGQLSGSVEKIVNEIVDGPSTEVANTQNSELTTADVAFSALNSLIPDDEVLYVDTVAPAQTKATDPTQAALDQNVTLLQQLQALQNQRLSAQPTFVLTHAPRPSESEVDAARKVVFNIQQLAAQATPAQLAPTEAVREVMHGPSQTENDDDCDMDVLREFLVVDND